MRKKKLWEVLSIVLATLLVIIIGGRDIALAQSAALNYALGISGSEIERSEDPAYQYFDSEFDSYDALSAEWARVAEQVEGEGIVLLKNDNNALPLNKGDGVSTFLTGSTKFNYATSGSSATNTSGYLTLKEALENEGFSINSALWDFYSSQKGRKKSGETYKINEVGFEEISADALKDLSSYGTAILTIARDSGEGSDISAAKSDGEDKSYLSISEAEESVLKELTALKSAGTVKKIVVLLNSSAPIELDFLYRDGIDVDAVLWIGNVGSGGISAVAKVLSGEIVPSGKLSDTYLRDNFSSPAMAAQSLNDLKSFAQTYTNADALGLNATQSHYGVYVEGIYVGYRYYETRYEDFVTGSGNAGDYSYANDVAYPFGFGVSYTDFALSDFSVAENGDTFDVTVTVTNTGATYSGKEVVEVYLSKPYTDYDKQNGVEKAAVELVGYAKTGVLAPGASETVTVTVDREQFRSYDRNGYKTYIVDEGSYYLTVANGSHEAVNNVLAARGFTPENTNGKMDAEGNADLVFETKVDALDSTTYAVSSHTGNAITNLFDFADLNKYEGSDTKVTYVSRSDWTGTWPQAAIAITVGEQMNKDLQSNRAIEEDPNATMPKYNQSGDLTLAKMRGKAYDDPEWEQLLDQMSFADQSYLVTNGQMTTVVVSSVGKPDTKESDGPNGLTASEGSLSFPSEGIWASTFNDELAKRVGELLAEDARNIGVTGLYANGINIHRTPFGGRSHEYFSEDPYLTGYISAAEIGGIQSKGVLVNVKHLAFNDQEAYRNGICVWLNEQEAREIMLAPFEYTLSADEGNAHGVMTAFNRVGTFWAGAIDALDITLVRGEWGFDGYSITDMASSNGASYMTWQDGILHGTDLFLGSGSETSLNEFKSSPTYATRMREASHRILYNIANYSAAMNGISPEMTIGAATWWWKTALDVAMWTVAGLTLICWVLWLLPNRKKENE